MHPTPHQRYLADTAETASPGRLVVMLYDGLTADLARAEQAMHQGSRRVAHERLLRAQGILAELLATLETRSWEGGPVLAEIYAYLLNELVAANVAQDPARVRACRTIVEPLGEAWREALAHPSTTIHALGSVA